MSLGIYAYGWYKKNRMLGPYDRRHVHPAFSHRKSDVF